MIEDYGDSGAVGTATEHETHGDEGILSADSDALEAAGADFEPEQLSEASEGDIEGSEGDYGASRPADGDTV